MAKFKMGDKVILISDNSIEGAIIGIFQDQKETNVFINSASRIIRARRDNWQEEALENINIACNTAWGRKIFSDNPDVKDIISKLKSNEIRIEDTVKLITDVENMHSFSNVIINTYDREYYVYDDNYTTPSSKLRKKDKKDG